MDIFSIFSSKKPEQTETSKENATPNSNSKNTTSKKKPTLNVSAADETVDFSVHYKNKILSIYLYINKKGVKETWKAKLNETEMNKLLYNLFLIFSNPEPFKEQIQAVYPNQQLEEILHVNPNPPLNLNHSLERLAELINK
jgi:hypothetical protein